MVSIFLCEFANATMLAHCFNYKIKTKIQLVHQICSILPCTGEFDRVIINLVLFGGMYMFEFNTSVTSNISLVAKQILSSVCQQSCIFVENDVCVQTLTLPF